MYKDIGEGRVAQFDGAKQIGPVLQEVSVCFDVHSGHIYKHGKPAMVRGWYNSTKQRMEEDGATGVADDLCLLTGQFKAIEINEVLGVPGRIVDLYRLIARQKVALVD